MIMAHSPISIMDRIMSELAFKDYELGIWEGVDCP